MEKTQLQVPSSQKSPASKTKTLQSQIKNLLIKKSLNAKILKPHHQPKHLYQDFGKDIFDSNTKNMIDVGQACKGVVVKKDDSKKQLWIHLTKLVIVEPQSKYRTSSVIASMSSLSIHQTPQQKFIHQFKQYAFVKDYSLKQPFSIFTYINSYKDIQIGSEVFGILTHKEKRVNEMTTNNNNSISQISQANNIWFELSIKNEVMQTKNIGKSKIPKYGIKYDQRFKETVNARDYQRFRGFSLSQLALYNSNFQNDDIVRSLKQKADIELNQNINPISNINALKHLHINFQRIRQVQEKKWAKKYFSEGLEFLKRGNNPHAIENLDLAKKFDKNNEKIYVAKGCALANMKNYSQGLKEIKQALKINPDNEQANQYYKTIRQKLRQKQIEAELKRKESGGSSARILVKKH